MKPRILETFFVDGIKFFLKKKHVEFEKKTNTGRLSLWSLGGLGVGPWIGWLGGLSLVGILVLVF